MSISVNKKLFDMPAGFCYKNRVIRVNALKIDLLEPVIKLNSLRENGALREVQGVPTKSVEDAL